MKALITVIEEWGYDRGITTNGKPITQAIKTLEECHELLEAINTNNKPEIEDAIGDIVITLIMQCRLQDIDFVETVEGSYNVIKDRTGFLNEQGDFIRDKDE